MQVLIYSGYYPEHKRLYDDIFELTQSLGKVYPNYRDWYYKTFLEDLKKGHRSYAIATHHFMVGGVCLMKNTPDEKKICTLFVNPKFRRQGIGTELMRVAFDELGDNPFLTVLTEKLPALIPFFRRFGFQMKLLPRTNQNNPHEVLFYKPVKNSNQPAVIQKHKALPHGQEKGEAHTYA